MIHANLSTAGRIVIPQVLRDEFQLKAGDRVYFERLPDGIKLTSKRQRVMAALASLREQLGDRDSLVDDLLRERRAEAERDSRDGP